MSKNEHPEARCVRVAFLNCFDATFFSASLVMAPAHEAKLKGLLSSLQEYGVLLLPREAPPPAALSFDDVVAHLRSAVGAHIVDSALAAEGSPSPADAGPIAVMPVWPFEPEGDDPVDRDVLLSSGRLWGADVLIEALRVDDPDAPVPVLTVRPRFERWLKAAGGGRFRTVIHPPGQEGSYFLAAISAGA